MLTCSGIMNMLQLLSAQECIIIIKPDRETHHDDIIIFLPFTTIGGV